MNKILPFLIIIILVSCQNVQNNTSKNVKIESFKIIIETDATSTGTKSRITLTNNSFEDRYLKDELMPQDTVMQLYENLEPNDKLKKISKYNIDDLKQSEIGEVTAMNFTFKKNGQSKTVRISKNPDDFICDVISFINDLSVEKYQLNYNCKK